MILLCCDYPKKFRDDESLVGVVVVPVDAAWVRDDGHQGDDYIREVVGVANLIPLEVAELLAVECPRDVVSKQYAELALQAHQLLSCRNLCGRQRELVPADSLAGPVVEYVDEVVIEQHLLLRGSKELREESPALPSEWWLPVCFSTWRLSDECYPHPILP